MSPFSGTGNELWFYVLFWGLFALAFGLFLQRAILLLCRMLAGRRESRSDHLLSRLKFMLVEIVLQRCNLKSVTRIDRSGLGHALMFWGFGLFFISYLIFIGLSAGFGLSTWLEGSLLERVYFSILDIAGLIVLFAVIWAAIRRYVKRPQRLKTNSEAGVILVLVGSLMLLNFLVEGFGYAAGDAPAYWPPIGAALAGVLDNVSQSALDNTFRNLWWLHYGIILGFLVYIPYSKHLHILTSPFNLLFRSSAPRGTLPFIDLDKESAAGASQLNNFSWKHLLDLYSCAECGRCSQVCPAQISGKKLSPQEMVHSLKNRLITSQPSKDNEALAGEEIWDCVTCRACQEVCPVNIEHIDKIVELRRGGVLMQSKFPAKIQQLYKNIEENSNPWGKAWVYRSNWSEGLNLPKPSLENPVDTIFWPGCLGAYDERIQRLATSLCRLLKTAGVNFTILGKEEKCCGDSIRRTGNEYLFQKLALQNIRLFQKYGVKRIITQCPHCYNVLKNEYPQFGGRFEVVHHTELIAGLLQTGAIPAPGQELNKTVVYHDPCYLGRHNAIYSSPRQVLQSIPGVKLVEKDASEAGSLCCGAGGGGMWMNESGERRISQILLEQVTAKKPEILATACPYCLTMLENEAREKGLGNSLAVMDLAEILQSTLIANNK